MLVPFDRDADAAYTEDVYNINDDRKVKLRRVRREKSDDLFALLERPRKRLDVLNWQTTCVSIAEGLEIAKELSRVHDEIGRLCRLSSLGDWVPEDAPSECRCGRVDARCLPAVYLRQVVEIVIL